MDQAWWIPWLCVEPREEARSWWGQSSSVSLGQLQLLGKALGSTLEVCLCCIPWFWNIPEAWRCLCGAGRAGPIKTPCIIYQLV